MSTISRFWATNCLKILCHSALLYSPPIAKVLALSWPKLIIRSLVLPSKHTGRVKAEKRTKTKVNTVITNDADQSLFADLKAKRMELAKAQSVPPYVIFHDKTLLGLAIQKPVNTDEMSQISGVGQKKIERYSSAFLSVIEKHLAQVA